MTNMPPTVRLALPDPCNTDQLENELRAAGVTVFSVWADRGDLVVAHVEGDDPATIAAVVAAHRPAPDVDRARAARLGELRAKSADGAPLTAAEQREAVALLLSRS